MKRKNHVPGLFDKASKILKEGGHTLPDAETGTIVFDDKSGISQEDQKDIIQNINQIMQSSKIKAAPDLFRIKAKKKGFGFPVLVNVVLLSILAAGVLVRWYFFRTEETNIASGAAKTSSGSGKAVIEEMKRKAQAALAAKDKEILDAQDTLKRINADLNSLKENMDGRVAEREKEIRDQYAAQLQAERDKLAAAGATTAEVEKKIQELEEAQRRLLLQEKERIVREAENERRLREQELLSQKDQFTVRLDTVQKERRDLGEAYQKELMKQEENLAEAESRLRSLSAQRDKFELINGQIVGFYSVIQQDIAAARYDEALIRLKDLREYFNQPGVLAVPEVSRRREVESFTIDSLEKLVAANRRPAVTETREPAAAAAEAGLIGEIRKLVLQADEAWRAGNKTRADGLYLQALELIPEINKSHRWFTDRVGELEAYRKTQVATHLAAAAAGFRARNYDEALAGFGRALEYLPTDQNTARLLNEIKTSGYEVERARLTREDAERAAIRLKQGDERLAAGDLDGAAARYLEILKTFPKMQAAADAAARLERTIKLKDEAFSAQLAGLKGPAGADITEYNEEIAVLKKTVAEREAEIASLKSGTPADSAELAALKKTLAEKEKEIAALEGTLRGSKDELTAQIAAVQSRIKELEAKIAAEERMSADYRRLQSDYASYSRNEDGVVRSGSIEELVVSKSYLDSFLSSRTVQSAFPGLLERIKRYDRAFEDTGRQSAVQDTVQIIRAANAFRTKEEKIAYLRKRMADLKRTDPTAVLLKSLIDLLS